MLKKVFTSRKNKLLGICWCYDMYTSLVVSSVVKRSTEDVNFAIIKRTVYEGMLIITSD